MIDCHAHLCFDESDIGQELLERAALAGVSSIVNICTTPNELERGCALAEKCKVLNVYTVASTTPHDVVKADPDFIKQIEKSAGKLVAIGETGLDYYYEHSPKKAQQDALKEYIELAIRVNLPLVIHCRDAFSDLFAIFDSYKNLPQIMLHCFTGTLAEAKVAQERGYYLSMSGIVTFAKSTALQEVARQIPSELLLLETDSPYLAPKSNRGKKNEPAFIKETAQFLASLREVSFEALCAQTTNNAKRLFNIS